jgi:NAD/NADP transhydrogenase beta subunit
MTVTRTNIEEVVDMLGNAESVIIVPGYGMSMTFHILIFQVWRSLKLNMRYPKWSNL